MFLECTRSVGFHPDNSSSISIQTSFFRKHGFRVENRKHYPRYVTMVRPEEKWNSPDNKKSEVIDKLS